MRAHLTNTTSASAMCFFTSVLKKRFLPLRVAESAAQWKLRLPHAQSKPHSARQHSAGRARGACARAPRQVRQVAPAAAELPMSRHVPSPSARGRGAPCGENHVVQARLVDGQLGAVPGVDARLADVHNHYLAGRGRSPGSQLSDRSLTRAAARTSMCGHFSAIICAPARAVSAAGRAGAPRPKHGRGGAGAADAPPWWGHPRSPRQCSRSSSP